MTKMPMKTCLILKLNISNNQMNKITAIYVPSKAKMCVIGRKAQGKVNY